MAKYSISNDLITDFQTAVGDLIDQLGKDCKLFYPPKTVSCSNCAFDSIGRKSANRYLHGGPIPFPDGAMCPMCNGAGLHAKEISDTITLLLYWSPKEWVDIGIQVAVPDGVVQTKGRIADLPKIKRANYILLHSDMEGYQHYRYQLMGEPVPQGLKQTKFFIAMWKRSG